MKKMYKVIKNKKVFVLENLLTNKLRADKRFYLVQRAKQYLAGIVLGIIIGALIGCILVGNPCEKDNKTSLSLRKQTIEVKAQEVTIPCDYDAITYIRCRGQQLGYKDSDISLFVRIAKEESHFNQYAKNPTSTAKGIYQFIDGTWRHYCLEDGNVYNFVDNINCFYKVLEQDGFPKALGHWNASVNKWGK
jgi:hypothetical protein